VKKLIFLLFTIIICNSHIPITNAMSPEKEQDLVDKIGNKNIDDQKLIDLIFSELNLSSNYKFTKLKDSENIHIISCVAKNHRPKLLDNLIKNGATINVQDYKKFI
jgi:hypothetical protein